jgi:hypothetical protein
MVIPNQPSPLIGQGSDFDPGDKKVVPGIFTNNATSIDLTGEDQIITMDESGLRKKFPKTGFWIAAFVILYIILGTLTLKNYSISWDEGLGNLFFGERYLNYFISFDASYLDFNEGDLPVHERTPNLFQSPWRDKANEFPPLADTVSALFMEVFAHRIQWLDPIDAFHLPKILLSGLLLGLLFWFAAPEMGNFAAFLGIFTLGFYPRFWGDMHFNPKDIPIAALFTFVIMLTYSWYLRPSGWKTIGIGILSGAALSIKANAVFLPFVIILGLWPWQSKWTPWEPVITHIKERFWSYAAMVGIAISTHVFSWPYLYSNPMGRIYRYYNFIFTQGERGGIGYWNPDAIIQTVITMPEILTLFLITGLTAAIMLVFKGKGRPFFQLIIVWCLVPIVRAVLPSAQNFDGIRHFLEFLPAAGLLMGYGAERITSTLTKWKPHYQKIWQVIVAGLLLLNLGIAHWVYHPYQYIYFNSLVGGLQGARDRLNLPEATDYWAVSYRQGINWLNQNAETGASISAPIAQWNFRLIAPLWLRSDLRYTSRSQIDEAYATGKPAYLMSITRENFYTPVIWECLQQNGVVYEIVIDRAPIMKICKFN